MSYNKIIYSGKSDYYYNQTREEMLKYILEDGQNILDVGCSSGAFGQAIKEKFPKSLIWGIEPDLESAHQAEKRLYRVIKGVYDNNALQEKSFFDIIFFNDVLEHLIDPWSSLDLAKTQLKPNGIIVASIPNVQCYSVVKNLLLKQEWEYTNSGIMDKTHLRFFTKKSIIRMFNDCGYTIEKIEGANSLRNASKVLFFLNIILGKRVENFNYVSFNVVAKIKK